MRRALPLGIALALMALVCVVGCVPKQPASPPAPAAQPAAQAPAPTTVRVGILTNARAPFWDPMVVGMERAAAKLPGCEAEWKAPGADPVSDQIAALESYKATGVDGVVISPRESAPLTPIIDDLIDAGVLVVCMDSDAPESKRLAYIGTNNYEAGKVAGEAAGEAFGRGAKVVGFVGDTAAENAKERLRGFEDAAAKYDIEVLDVRQDNNDPAKARENAEDVMKSMPEVTGFLALWSYDGPAITQAVIGAEKQEQIKIVAFDAEPATIDHLKKGEIQATVVQNPYLFGYLGVELIWMMKTMGVEETQKLLPPDGIVDTGARLVTPDNVDEFLEFLEDLGVESS